jgi:hypothetical protein
MVASDKKSDEEISVKKESCSRWRDQQTQEKESAQ